MVQLIRLPALSPTMEQGSLSTWHVSEGDSVDAGDLLAEIETDKTTMEFEAIDPGVIGKILVPAGPDPVAVNEPIAVLLEGGESLPDDLSALTDSIADSAPVLAASEMTAPVQQARQKTGAASSSADSVTPLSGDISPTTDSTPAMPTATRIFASPLARRLAEEKNIDLAMITGTGPHGRIVKADIDHAPAATVSAVVPPATAPQSDIAAQFHEREMVSVPLDNMRRTVAARLTEAKQTIPHFYLRREFIIDPLLDIRAAANTALAEQNFRISINDFVIRASALALQTVPEANAIWAHDQILRLKPSDIAVAVAIDGGLLTPIIRDAESKSVQQISVEMKALAAKAKSKKLLPGEYTGGAFSISNLGMFGISSFDAVINPPQASILAVGAAQRRAIEKDDGSIGFATLMPVTLSCDHRVIDGAVGAQLLEAMATKIENPMSLLL